MKKPNGSKAEAERVMKPLKRGNDTFALEYGGYSQNTFRALPDKDTELEDLLRPGFWIHIAKDRNMHVLKTWDRVVCIVPEKFWAEVLVLNHEPRLQLQVLRSEKLDKVEEMNAALGLPEGYAVVRIPENGKYRAVRTADNWPMSADFDTHEQARRELIDHNVFVQR